jgi:hypothetical protein
MSWLAEQPLPNETREEYEARTLEAMREYCDEDYTGKCNDRKVVYGEIPCPGNGMDCPNWLICEAFEKRNNVAEVEAMGLVADAEYGICTPEELAEMHAEDAKFNDGLAEAYAKAAIEEEELYSKAVAASNARYVLHLAAKARNC